MALSAHSGAARAGFPPFPVVGSGGIAFATQCWSQGARTISFMRMSTLKSNIHVALTTLMPTLPFCRFCGGAEVSHKPKHINPLLSPKGGLATSPFSWMCWVFWLVTRKCDDHGKSAFPHVYQRLECVTACFLVKSISHTGDHSHDQSSIRSK